MLPGALAASQIVLCLHFRSASARSSNGAHSVADTISDELNNKRPNDPSRKIGRPGVRKDRLANCRSISESSLHSKTRPQDWPSVVLAGYMQLRIMGGYGMPSFETIKAFCHEAQSGHWQIGESDYVPTRGLASTYSSIK